MEFVFNAKYPDGAPVKILDDGNFRARHPQFQFMPLREGVARHDRVLPRRAVTSYNTIGAKRMKILVTGGAGYIGSVLCPLL